MKIKRTWALLCLLAGFALPGLAQADRIVGIYEVTGPETGYLSKVEIYKTGSTYEAKVIWLEEPNFPDGTLKTDIKNPNPDLRNTPADQIVLVKGMQYDADKKIWGNCKIYNPEHGKYYKVQMKFDGERKLCIRGYVGTPALGMTLYWNKIQ